MSDESVHLDPNAISPIYRRRLFVNRFNLAMSLATMAFGMAFLLWILAVLFGKGFEALSPTLFTQMTPPPGSAGGLANAIFGSLVIVASATLISTPIGILAGIYLAEYGRGSALARATRFINDILLSAPSIVIGNAYKISAGLFEPGNSIASALANEFNEAADPVHRASLIALGLVLFVLTFIVLALSRMLIARC